MISPEQFEMIQKGGMLALLLIAIGWLITDRNRLLASLKEKEKQLLDLSVGTIQSMTEFKGLLQTVIDIFNGRKQ